MHNPKYQQFKTDSDPFRIEYNLVPHLMAAWKQPIRVTPVRKLEGPWLPAEKKFDKHLPLLLPWDVFVKYPFVNVSLLERF